MKFKKIMLIGFFLLAILTIGAASASENITVGDELAADDTTGDSIKKTSVDE